MYKSRFHLFYGKLRFRWQGPYVVKTIFLHATIEIENPLNENIFKVNGQRLKPFLEPFEREELSRISLILSIGIFLEFSLFHCST